MNNEQRSKLQHHKKVLGGAACTANNHFNAVRDLVEIMLTEADMAKFKDVPHEAPIPEFDPKTRALIEIRYKLDTALDELKEIKAILNQSISYKMDITVCDYIRLQNERNKK